MNKEGQELPRHWVVHMARVFGLGCIPTAPGTFGTLAGIPLVFIFSWGSDIFYMFSAGVFVLFSVVISQVYENLSGKSDPKEVVIDEVAGFVVAMTWLPLTWQSLFLAFVLFRFFDALKPFPISVVDRKIKGGLGVVADDLVAGIFTNIIMQLVYTRTDWLGSQLIL